MMKYFLDIGYSLLVIHLNVECSYFSQLLTPFVLEEIVGIKNNQKTNHKFQINTNLQLLKFQTGQFSFLFGSLVFGAWLLFGIMPSADAIKLHLVLGIW